MLHCSLMDLILQSAAFWNWILLAGLLEGKSTRLFGGLRSTIDSARRIYGPCEPLLRLACLRVAFFLEPGSELGSVHP